MPDQTYSVTIRATDSVGLSADWSGAVAISSGPPSPSWIIGPVIEGAGSVPNALIIAETLDDLSNRTPFPAGVNVSRISSANGAVFLHGGSNSRVSFDKCQTWTPTNLVGVSAITHDGTYFIDRNRRSADGISWSDFPTVPPYDALLRSHAVDGLILSIFKNNGSSLLYFGVTYDSGETWVHGPTGVGPFGLRVSDGVICTDGSSSTFVLSDTALGVSSDFGATISSPSGAGSHHQQCSVETGTFLSRTGSVYGRWRPGQTSAPTVLTQPGTAQSRNSNNYLGVGDLWVAVAAQSGSLVISVSEDDALTWATRVVLEARVAGDISVAALR